VAIHGDIILSRITTRIFLGLALLLALTVIGVVISQSSSNIATVGATLAAALAVVTAVVSAWGAQRVVELEEDRQRPYPYPSFDLSSRYGLVLFRIENSGGSAAHDISIVWSGDSLTNSAGNEVRFSDNNEGIQIPVLLPSQSISKMVDGNIEFFKSEHKHQYSGVIKFQDSAGRKYSHQFKMDAGMYLGTPTHSEEEIKTQFELQKIPEHLKNIEGVLNKIRNEIKGQEKNDL